MGVPWKINGAPRNIHGNLTACHPFRGLQNRSHRTSKAFITYLIEISIDILFYWHQFLNFMSPRLMSMRGWPLTVRSVENQRLTVGEACSARLTAMKYAGISSHRILCLSLPEIPAPGSSYDPNTHQKECLIQWHLKSVPGSPFNYDIGWSISGVLRTREECPGTPSDSPNPTKERLSKIKLINRTKIIF